MKNILILGGGGYIGTEVTKLLLKKNNVTVYDCFYFPWLVKNRKRIKNNKRLNLIKKDILDINIKDFKNIDIVCYFIGIANDSSSDINKKYSNKINFSARYKAAQIAKKANVKRYIFNSTCSIYGFNKNKVFENSLKNPLSTYAKSVYKADNKIFNLKSNNFKVNVLRNATLFGYSDTMRFDLVINKFTYLLTNKKKIKIDGDGKQYRPFLSISDISKMYENIIDNNLRSFCMNAVSFSLTIESITQKILKILNKSSKLLEYNYANKDKRNYNVGSKIIEKDFKNFRFSNLKQEIKAMVKAIKRNKLIPNKNTIRYDFYDNKLK